MTTNATKHTPGYDAYNAGVIEIRHTPGPWKYGPSSRQIYAAETGEHIATMYGNVPLTRVDRTVENANLIASAPDLLAERDHLRAENAELRIVLQELVIDAVWDGKTPIRSDGYRNFMMREQSLERARATLAKQVLRGLVARHRQQEGA